MGSILIHTQDESVTLTAQAVRRLLEKGDGDAALLYLALLRHHGTVQPRSLAGAFEARGDLSGSVITSGVEVVDMTSKPRQDVETYTVEAGSPEVAAVEKSLQEYSYRLCWDSLTGKSLIEDIGAVSVKLYGPEGDLSVFSGTGKIRLNGRTVRLTGGRSADLCEKLRTALPGEN